MTSGDFAVAALRPNGSFDIIQTHATLMPLLIGESTLKQMESLPPDGPPVAVKVTRPEVKRHARRALWMALTGRITPC